MYSYCNNNPVLLRDGTGTRPIASATVKDESSYDRFISCDHQKQVHLEERNPEPIGTYSGGKVYLVKDESELYTTFPGDVVALDYRGSKETDNVQINYSHLIKDKEQQREILTIIDEYEDSNFTGWDRTVDSMMIEWEVHNEGAFLGNIFGLGYSSSINVNLDNNSEGWTKFDHYKDGAKKIRKQVQGKIKSFLSTIVW